MPQNIHTKNFLGKFMEKMVCSSAVFADSFEKTIKDGGFVPVVVTGNSMNPFLVNGRDVVWLSACGEKDFKKGKILLFKQDDEKLVLHRLRKILPNEELLMNGDAQIFCEKIKKNQVIAVAVWVERQNKKRRCRSRRVWQMLMPLRPYMMRLWRKKHKLSELFEKWKGHTRLL